MSQGTAFHKAAGALSGQNSSLCGGERGSSIQGAGILNSEYLHKAQVSHTCRFLCPVLLSESSWIVFLICSPWFVDTFNMRENYFDISLSVILTLINTADLVLFGVWVHHKESCWKSSITISASLPNVLSCSEKRLVFSDPDTQFPTVGDAARKTLGRRPAIKLYCRKTQHIFSSTLCGVMKNYLSPECKAEAKINFQFEVASLSFWLLKVTKSSINSSYFLLLCVIDTHMSCVRYSLLCY